MRPVGSVTPCIPPTVICVLKGTLASGGRHRMVLAKSVADASPGRLGPRPTPGPMDPAQVVGVARGGYTARAA